MAKEVVIEGICLTAGYGKGKQTTKVVSNFSFTLHQGDFVLMLGCNGAGKSTLLRTLSGVQAPLSGDIEICRTNIKRLSSRELSRRVSTVFTDKTMAGALLVEEVVALGRHPYTGFFGKMSQNDRQIVSNSLMQVGMLHKSKKYLSQLSDGERQKVMIAKALAQQTEIIILDEPTAFLDLPSRIEILYLLKRLSKEENKTILLSTHDIEQSMSVSDKLILFLEDEVKCVATDRAIESGDVEKLFVSRGVEYNRETGRFIPKEEI